MSWRVAANGDPRTAKSQLVTQFVSAKVSCASIPAEVKSIENAEKIVSDALDFHIEQSTQKVDANAYGSACLRGEDWRPESGSFDSGEERSNSLSSSARLRCPTCFRCLPGNPYPFPLRHLHPMTALQLGIAAPASAGDGPAGAQPRSALNSDLAAIAAAFPHSMAPARLFGIAALFALFISRKRDDDQSAVAMAGFFDDSGWKRNFRHWMLLRSD